MKLLSDLENLDNIVDGENKKLDIHYIDITSPYFVFNSMEPGLYINNDLSIVSNTRFKLNDTCTEGLHISYGLRFYLYIIQNPSTVEDDTVFAYLYTVRGSNATVGSNLLSYKVTLEKDLSAASGLHLSNYSEKVFISDLPSKYSSCFIGTSGSTYNKVGELGVSQFLQPCYLQVALNSGNTAQRALTLNVNSGGARPIYINGEPSSATNYDLPRGTYIVYTDGTNYYFNTDGTIPGVVHGDDSIKRIIEIDYDDYKELENNDEVDPDTEYHIKEGTGGGSIETLVKQLIQEDAERKHPIGSLEFNTSGENPASYLGFGTWVAWGEGRVPIGVGTNGTNTYSTADATGGADTNWHYHDLTDNGYAKIILKNNGNIRYREKSVTPWTDNFAILGSHSTSSSGDSQYYGAVLGGTTDGNTIDIRQSYVTCYMWKRTA